MKSESREFANETLGERRCYVFVEMKKNLEDEAADDEPKPITLNGAAIRTPSEDIVWEEQ